MFLQHFCGGTHYLKYVSEREREREWCPIAHLACRELIQLQESLI